MSNLLAIDTNAKTKKGEKLGVMTGILYLAPNTQSGIIDTCPLAKIAGCDKACLYSAGRGRFNNVQQGRIRKTRLFAEDRETFFNTLVNDICKLERKAKREGKTPMIRLNGTSDIQWESEAFSLDNEEGRKIAKRNGLAATRYASIMDAFPHLQFYDYTKIASRFTKELPKNYDLTFSYSGVKPYQKQVQRAIKAGARMAVVFRKASEIPAKFMGMDVVDGDGHDVRAFDPQGVVVALKAKGDAIKDTSGFVVG